jgi:hypothetical protein
MRVEMNLDREELLASLDNAMDALTLLWMAAAGPSTGIEPPLNAFDEALGRSPEHQKAQAELAARVEQVRALVPREHDEAVLDLEAAANANAVTASRVAYGLGLRARLSAGAGWTHFVHDDVVPPAAEIVSPSPAEYACLDAGGLAFDREEGTFLGRTRRPFAGFPAGSLLFLPPEDNAGYYLHPPLRKG